MLEMKAEDSKTAILSALIANLIIAASKYTAAILTQSSVMLSEAVHSTVDIGNETLLLIGKRRSQIPPHSKHPLGHSREIPFMKESINS
jgi:divalent metal cation (Fe/Co/Zn/Cd) transporter